MNRDTETVSFTGVRTEATGRTAGYIRFEVRPGCWVTLFDDGRTRFLMDETAEYVVTGKNQDAHRPGARMIEHKPKR